MVGSRVGVAEAILKSTDGRQQRQVGLKLEDWKIPEWKTAAAKETELPFQSDWTKGKMRVSDGRERRGHIQPKQSNGEGSKSMGNTATGSKSERVSAGAGEALSGTTNQPTAPCEGVEVRQKSEPDSADATEAYRVAQYLSPLSQSGILWAK